VVRVPGRSGVATICCRSSRRWTASCPRTRRRPPAPTPTLSHDTADDHAVCADARPRHPRDVL